MGIAVRIELKTWWLVILWKDGSWHCSKHYLNPIDLASEELNGKAIKAWALEAPTRYQAIKLAKGWLNESLLSEAKKGQKF